MRSQAALHLGQETEWWWWGGRIGGLRRVAKWAWGVEERYKKSGECIVTGRARGRWAKRNRSKKGKKKKHVLRWRAITLRLTSSIRYGMKMTTLGCHTCARPWKLTPKGFTVLRDAAASSSFILVALSRSSFFFRLSVVFNVASWKRSPLASFFDLHRYQRSEGSTQPLSTEAPCWGMCFRQTPLD